MKDTLKKLTMFSVGALIFAGCSLIKEDVVEDTTIPPTDDAEIQEVDTIVDELGTLEFDDEADLNEF